MQPARAQRRHDDARTIARQCRIERLRGASALLAAEPGRYRKRRALDCGRARCALCGNPRRNGAGQPLTVAERMHRWLLREGLMEAATAPRVRAHAA